MSPQPPRVACFEAAELGTPQAHNLESLIARPSSPTQQPTKPSDASQSNPRPSKRPKPIPPAALVAPFGNVPNSTGPLTPLPEDDGNDKSKRKNNNAVDVTKPTCSLNLVCYRSGNCIARQIRVISEDRMDDWLAYQMTKRQNQDLISSDRELFETLRRIYRTEMCGFWRRFFSLKTLRRLRLLSYTKDSRPAPVPFDEFTMQEVLWAYNHPSSFSKTETEWIEWVFRLRQLDKRHALEFVEGWNGTRIAIFGTIPCVASTLVGVIWSALGGDVQTAFTVAGFILTVATVLLALLAVISGIDSSSSRS